MVKEEALVVEGTVNKAEANGRFLVELDMGRQIAAYTTGNMRRHNIRVVLGDRVRVELSPYDLSQGRIVYRER